MRAAAHGPAIHFRHTEGGALGRDNDVGSAADADAAAQDEAVHGHDHRFRVAVNGLEAVVVALVHRDDQVAVGSQFLDIDPGTEAATFRANHDHPHVVVAAQALDLAGDIRPALVVEGVDRWPVEHQFGNAVFDADAKWFHGFLPSQCLAPYDTRRHSSPRRASASRTICSINWAQLGKLSMDAAICPAGNTPAAGCPSTMAFWITIGALAAMMLCAAVCSPAPRIFRALPSN